MRKNLKLFRVKNNLTQDEIAAKIGYTRGTYQAIEKGLRDGRKTFWNDLQRAFNIADADMWNLQKNEK